MNPNFRLFFPALVVLVLGPIPHGLCLFVMAEELVQQSFGPRICVMNPPEVDEFIRNMQHESLLSLLQYAPSPDEITVRNTRKMSSKPQGFKPEFIPIPGKTEYPGIEKSNSLLEEVLDPENDKYHEWLRCILGETLNVLSPFETWSHPVAGILAINANNPEPLDALQCLVDESYERFGALPFVNAEFLRYFVVIHDEGSDYNQTLALFEHVKQKFGPHSAILRLGSSQDQQNTDNAATLIRNIMSQSVVPFMEECCGFWYEQIAATKQGFAGRLLSVGRRYLTTSSKISVNVLEHVSRKTQRFLNSPFGQKSLQNAYNVDDGYYHWSAPQAQLRKIADFAVILRDYKFANGIYEMLRKEFTSDKAWGYAASCQEMSCVTSLLFTQGPLLKDSNVDTLLDSSFYTYISRCQLPLWALRCILTVTELLVRLPIENGTLAFNSYSTLWSIKWLTKLLSEELVTPLSHPVICERISNVYRGFNQGSGVGSRHRKQSFWLLIASSEWLEQGYQKQSQRCFAQCEQTYRDKTFEHEPLYTGIIEKLQAGNP